MKLSEHQIQCQVIEEADFLAMSDHRWGLLFAIPNGARTSMGTAVKLKREGLKKGVPDLFLAYPSGGFHGLFIEMKSPKGSASYEQKEWIAALQDQGYKAVICKSASSAIATIREYLSAPDE